MKKNILHININLIELSKGEGLIRAQDISSKLREFLPEQVPMLSLERKKTTSLKQSCKYPSKGFLFNVEQSEAFRHKGLIDLIPNASLTSLPPSLIPLLLCLSLKCPPR